MYIPNTTKNPIVEGGLAGHLSHIHEDLDLTFSDIIRILNDASSGRLENVTEKVDGQNFFFTYNLTDRTLRFARNKGNIKTGGMTGADVEAKWQDKPSVAKAFTDAYNVMNKALVSLDDSVKRKIFGSNGDVWYSAEVISTANPNVINYDRNAIIFHDSGTKYNTEGVQIDDYNPAPGFQTLTASVSAMQSELEKSKIDWTVFGPLIVQLQKLSNKQPLTNALNKVKKLMSQFKLSNNNSLRDFAASYIVINILREYPGDINQKKALANIIVDENTPGIREKKVALKAVYTDPEEFNAIATLVNLGPKIIGKALSSIESIITEFGIEMLKGVQSQVALHPDASVNKIKDELKQAIKQIEGTSDERSLDILSRQLSRLRSVDNVTTSMEGIVFKYNGKAYKIVGAFAPINQLLGFFRYGR